ncbi:c-type cytochrome [Massilia horti]|uniref:C-type cytochrome n=1 Tax=Massilia horti TaxID=2562153 RepID=A0A4Y9T4Y8_9BURK|nr:c-type cytochrome [Massilia horti]TFW32162.1 c-type cytochrome [Massilia horti]
MFKMPLCRPAMLASLVLLAACGGGGGDYHPPPPPPPIPVPDPDPDPVLVKQGLEVFRNNTFGDEAKWSDTLRLHEVLDSCVDPNTALSLGLKVDVDALPPELQQGIKNGSVDLGDPQTTVKLIKLGAVVGLVGKVEAGYGRDMVTRVGVTCALCHSTVDDSLASGIGKRLDGLPNRSLNIGAILALSSTVSAKDKKVFESWGPGRYDPRYNLDGKNGPVMIPPIYGLKGLRSITYTGDGDDVAYWNRYVAVTQMGGMGHFDDARIGVDVTNGDVDLVGPVLPALRAYQLSLVAPPPPAGSYDMGAAARGRALFIGKGQCVSCHSGPQFTDEALHSVLDVVSEASYASRSATKQYRTSSLIGVWQHAPYFHSGEAATLEDVVNTYNDRKALGLNPQEIADLAQYLKSL